MKTIHVLAMSTLATLAFGQTGFTTIYTFTNGSPVGLTLANGLLYGAFDGFAPNGSDCGTFFELKPPAALGGAWAKTVLHSFAATNTDGCSPVFAPIMSAGGALYGLTYTWGAYGFGGLYELLPPTTPGGAWTESLRYSFGIDSGSVVSNLVVGPAGSFYVLTAGGLLQLLPPTAPGGAWTGTVLYSFPAYAQPSCLAVGAGGVLYGATYYNGAEPGLIFQLTPPAAPGGAWTETVLYNLLSGQGSNPNTLTVASDGTLYGTTYGTEWFGDGGAGTVYKLAPPAVPGGAWTYTMLKNFGVNHPDQQLIVRDGDVFGSISTQQGGAVFELHAPSQPGGDWPITFPHNFTNGQTPGNAMIIDKAGTLFGATADFYSQPAGSVYEIVPE